MIVDVNFSTDRNYGSQSLVICTASMVYMTSWYPGLGWRGRLKRWTESTFLLIKNPQQSLRPSSQKPLTARLTNPNPNAQPPTKRPPTNPQPLTTHPSAAHPDLVNQWDAPAHQGPLHWELHFLEGCWHDCLLRAPWRTGDNLKGALASSLPQSSAGWTDGLDYGRDKPGWTLP